MRTLACLTLLAMTALRVGDAGANPLPTPTNRVEAHSQSVSISMYSCEGTAVSAWRVPASSAPYKVDGYSCNMDCTTPVQEPAGAVHLNSTSCSEMVQGDPEYSPGEYEWVGGSCLTESCVPVGRWKYVLWIKEWEYPDYLQCTVSLVVDVTEADSSCPVVLPEPVPDPGAVEAAPATDEEGPASIPDPPGAKGCGAGGSSGVPSSLILLTIALGLALRKRSA